MTGKFPATFARLLCTNKYVFRLYIDIINCARGFMITLFPPMTGERITQLIVVVG